MITVDLRTEVGGRWLRFGKNDLEVSREDDSLLISLRAVTIGLPRSVALGLARRILAMYGEVQ